MNREIKFRVWDKVAKAMSDPFDLFGEFILLGAVHDWQREVRVNFDPADSLGMLNDLDVMQFTGLHDKNGKEIYEGDILQFFEKPVAIVVWQDFGGWSYEWIDPVYKRVRRSNPEPFFLNISLFEIIGNIYANPELIENTPTKWTYEKRHDAR